MPQGGVNDGENYIDACKKRIEEETSIKNIEILKEIDEWTELMNFQIIFWEKYGKANIEAKNKNGLY